MKAPLRVSAKGLVVYGDNRLEIQIDPKCTSPIGPAR
jgi:hypothetical protein